MYLEIVCFLWPHIFRKQRVKFCTSIPHVLFSYAKILPQSSCHVSSVMHSSPHNFWVEYCHGSLLCSFMHVTLMDGRHPWKNIFEWFTANLCLNLSQPSWPLDSWGLSQSTEITLYLKYCETLFTHNTKFSQPILLKFCTEHSIHTAMLCAKFQNDLSPEKEAVGKKRLWKISVRARFWMNCPYCYGLLVLELRVRGWIHGILVLGSTPRLRFSDWWRNLMVMRMNFQIVHFWRKVFNYFCFT